MDNVLRLDRLETFLIRERGNMAQLEMIIRNVRRVHVFYNKKNSVSSQTCPSLDTSRKKRNEKEVF